MLKRILSVLAGVAAGLLVVTGTDYLCGKLYPPPANIDYKDMEAVKMMLSNMPLNAFFILLAGYALSSLLGGLVATLVSGRENSRAALIVGGVLMVGGLMNVTAVPGHPMWFIVTSTILYVPAAYVGYLLMRSRRPVA